MKSKAPSRAIPELIASKRDGNALSDAEIKHLIEHFTSGEMPDYQMSALAMAIFFQGMSFDETVALTLAMRDSGRVLSWDDVAAPKVDKHSTGGVGDKVSICLAPIVAACGVAVPMMSGRGLAHSGGTLDKLEAIPGFRVDLSIRELRAQVRKLGLALIGQTLDLAPADRRLYALRDVTATVESIPLITASILSKKLAEGVDGLVLDVKVGQGAFMKTHASARELARSIVRVGQLAGTRVTAIVTDMNSPLGMAVGNAIETAEAFEVLHGRGPDDVREVTLALGAEMLRSAGIAKTRTEALRLQQSVIADGSAVAKMRAVVAAQGGDPSVVDSPDRLRPARYRASVRARRGGFVRDIHAREIGLAAVGLGAGRLRTEDTVDPGAGVLLRARRGDRVRKNDELATVYTSRRALLPAGTKRVQEAFTIGSTRPKARPLIIETIRR